MFLKADYEIILILNKEVPVFPNCLDIIGKKLECHTFFCTFSYTKNYYCGQTEQYSQKSNIKNLKHWKYYNHNTMEMYSSNNQL